MTNPVSQAIIEFRRSKGWTQEDLAERVGLSQPSIAALEAGNTRVPRKWRELADTIGMEREQFRRLLVVSHAAANTETMERSVDDAGRPAYRINGKPASFNEFEAYARKFAAWMESKPNAQIGEGLDPVPGEQIPVYGRAQGGPDGKFEFNGEVMGWEQRPPNLRGVRGVYAVYIDGESMYPRYKPGETVVAHPGRPIAKGDDVVVQVAPEEEGEAPLGYVKELVSLNSKELIVKQFNPDIEIRFPRERVISVHRIVSADR